MTNQNLSVTLFQQVVAIIRSNEQPPFLQSICLFLGKFIVWLLSINKPPFAEAFMLVSRLFCRSVAKYQQMAVVSFAENGRFQRQVRLDNRPIADPEKVVIFGIAFRMWTGYA